MLTRSAAAGKRAADKEPTAHVATVRPRAARRASQPSWHEALANQSDSEDDSDCSEADDLEFQLFSSKLRRVDPWPLSEPPPEIDRIIDPAGPWGANACGVEIRKCDDSSKGKGAFASTLGF